MLALSFVINKTVLPDQKIKSASPEISSDEFHWCRYMVFWLVVLGAKFAFAYFLLVCVSFYFDFDQ